jgi:hypothetical protein
LPNTDLGSRQHLCRSIGGSNDDLETPAIAGRELGILVGGLAHDRLGGAAWPYCKYRYRRRGWARWQYYSHTQRLR